ncbi:transcriptional regulator [Mucilaginibacter limnophilus]|uniref:Transcriptional regulator n=1 Tax=Mucilaginibacter limnophilus TaxID=1932778 RepID=A0A437ML39_9SPHI|nr:triple tyrosine motif-containing protein [Mucilaginibacter limnophilus]RVT98333.1 transcriptional regulator [Mucilaginibacter limnophilus]
MRLSTVFQFIIIAVLLPVVAFGARIRSIGVPYVQNYPKTVYQAGNQNWAETRDGNGIMYFANSEGLLSYDGHNWQLYRLPNGLIVRAVAADGKGKIYTGAFGEIGYWSAGKDGVFRYTSLVKLIPKKFPLKEEIWKIHIDEDRILFQSFGTIYIYRNGRISVVNPPLPFQPYLFLFKAGNRYLVERLNEGLYELQNDKLAFISGSNVLKSGILSILPFGGNRYLIATSKNGLFIYDGASVTPWATQADDFIKRYQINNGVAIPGNYFAFGTILNGIIIIDGAGNVVQHINKSSGLQNNTVLSLYLDKEQNLWAGLDNGIDRIEIISPLYFYFDKSGQFGTVYSSIIHNNKIYLGTNQGLFYSDWIAQNNRPFQSFNFKFVAGSQGQVWDLSLLDGKLLCGHNEGTYQVEGDKISKISSENGGWSIRKLNDNQLVQGTYTGLAVYRKDAGGNWVFDYKVKNFSAPSRYVEKDNKGQLWVSHAYKGVYKIRLNADGRTAASVKYYDDKNGLPGGYNVNVFNLNNQILFSSNAGFYIYDEISDKFFRYNQLNNMLGSFRTANKIISANWQKYWFIDHGRVALADLSVNGRLKLDSTSFRVLSGRMVKYYESISRISNNLFLISIDDGFAIYNDDGKGLTGNTPLPAVLIRKIERFGDKIRTVKRRNDIQLPYKENNLRVNFSLPYYRQARVEFQYYLKGYSDKWSEWTTQTQKEFTSLSQGDYQLQVRARVNEQVSDITTLSFSVKPPWYLRRIAFVGYLILVVIIYYAAKRYYQFKIRKHQQRLQKKLQAEKEEFVKKEAAAQEQRMVKLKYEQLQNDLDRKSRELANSAMNIVYKNELLQRIHDEITELKDAGGKKLPPEQLRKIQKVIDDGMNDERDWVLFENSFNETHENFFKKLKAQHPDLVPNDLKLCAYLRMNMNSKEMASLLNISLRGIEIRRYRLRKKLGLEHDQNLVEFLMAL